MSALCHSYAQGFESRTTDTFITSPLLLLFFKTISRTSSFYFIERIQTYVLDNNFLQQLPQVRACLSQKSCTDVAPDVDAWNFTVVTYIELIHALSGMCTLNTKQSGMGNIVQAFTCRACQCHENQAGQHWLIRESLRRMGSSCHGIGRSRLRRFAPTLATHPHARP